MTYRLFIDLETYSETPISHGTYRYAANAEIMLFAWALDEQPAQVWDTTSGEPMPFDLEVALAACTEVCAHNAMFDRTVMRSQMPEVCPVIERWRDTMVRALCHSLPGKLETLCQVLGVPEDKAKVKRGKQLVQLFCKPRPKTSKVQRATRDTHPTEWAEFVDYARLDVEAMREVERRLPKWNYRGDELALWHLDQTINDRGVAIDIELANAALAAVDAEQVVLAARTVEMTNGEVQTATQRDAMLQHMLAEYGVQLPDMQSATLERRLGDPDIPEAMKDLLRVRLQASTTSTSKYKSLVRATNLDGRIRGLLQFAGASRTARWSGRTFQPQNLARGTLKPAAVEAGIAAMKAGAAGLIYENVMEVASSAIRGCIVAPPGKKLVIADLSNIEGRALAWLAGEEWKLQAFRDFDAGTGHDLYKLAYAKSFGIAPEAVTKDQRQVGKVQELALGFAGGVGAFVTFAAAYGIDLDELAAGILPTAPVDLVEDARSFLAWMRKQPKANTFGMADDTFVGCDVVKRGWRNGHPAIAAWWPMLEQAFHAAIESPNYTFNCGTVKVRRDGSWLRILLPSGRYLCYPAPDDDQGRCSYMGVDQYTRKWQRIPTYSGKLAENCIAGGTLVVTDHGAVPIEQVSTAMRVWDGVEFVSHAGVAPKGEQKVIESFGVWMTPEHMVLTTEGWARGDTASREGRTRAACGLPAGAGVLHAPCAAQSQAACGGVRLWQGSAHAAGGLREVAAQREHLVVRLQAGRNGVVQATHARHEQAPRLRGLALHTRQVPFAYAPSVAQLRRARDNGVRAVAGVVREFLGGHARDLRTGAFAGPGGQLCGVLQSELPLGFAQGASQQPPRQSHGGGLDSGAVFRGHRNQPDDGAVPLGAGRAPVATGRSAQRSAQVFDIIDCGPLTRFVCLDSDGQPVIVHNCTQAFARDVLAHNMPAIEAEGYRIVLSVHDELLTETPDSDEYSSDHLAALMSTVPPWAEGLPLAAAGFETYRYRKD